MALNISQGSGATLATDQINGEHLQRISAVSIHPLPAGTNFIGLASIQGNVNVGNTVTADVTGQGDVPVTLAGETVGLAAGTNYVGLASVSGNVVVTNAGTFPVQSTLQAGSAAIGKLAANSGVDIGDVDVTSLPALSTGANFIGLATVNVGSAIPAGGNYIGLATVVPAFISNYTSFATVISAAGSASLFTPPSGQRWILKDLLIGALGANEVKIMSGGTDITPPISLATTGGYVSNFGDNGLRATAADNSFGVNLQSAATISIMANVRFE